MWKGNIPKILNSQKTPLTQKAAHPDTAET